MLFSGIDPESEGRFGITTIINQRFCQGILKTIGMNTNLLMGTLRKRVPFEIRSNQDMNAVRDIAWMAMNRKERLKTPRAIPGFLSQFPLGFFRNGFRTRHL